MVFSKKYGKFVAKKGGPARMMDLQIVLDKESYERLTPSGARIPSKSTMTSTPGTGDTGATICCTGVAMLDKLGIRRYNLLKTSVGLTVADKRVVTILGVVPVFITTRRAISKEGVHTRQLLYIVRELKGTFISRDALEDLGVISKYFPEAPPANGKAEVAGISAMEREAEDAKDLDLRVDK